MSGNMERVLRLMAEKKGSDVFLTAHSPIQMKLQGQMVPVNNQVLAPHQPRQLIAEVLTPAQMEELEDTGELNMSVNFEGIGSFRLSAFKQRGTVAAVFRFIPTEIPPLNSLNVPPVLANLILEKRGLILMVGATGTGKSTTLAAMLEHRNQNKTGHILTLEDPLEFLFTNKKSIVNQREVGRDTHSLQIGLKNALRQAPDCILIGEIRDRETMTAAISYALSGHLVLATMHANNSYHSLGRILSFYSTEARNALLSDLSSALKAVISQRLLRTPEGGRVPAVEVLLNTKLISELIEKGDIPGIKESVDKSMAEGSQTFETDIARLIKAGLVTREEGLLHSDSPTNLMWRLENEDPSASKAQQKQQDEPENDEPSFTEITLDVRSEQPRPAGFGTPR